MNLIKKNILLEHVRWFIVEKPVKLGYAALEMIKDVLTIPAMSYEGKYVADLRYPPNPDGNNRDLQKGRDRPIYYFDMMTSSCVPLPRLKVKYIDDYRLIIYL